MRTANRLRRRGERGTEEGLTPRLWLALVVLCVGQLMIVLDTTVVNVALPVLQRQLGFSQDSVAWVIDAYLITFGGLLLLAGRLGDLLGRRRVFLFGIVLFSISSLACGLAGDQTLLIAARFLQGAGAAVMAAMVLGILVTLFPEPRRRVLAMSVYAFVASAGASLGLLVGGLLTQAVSWHWIFFVNVPIGALVLGLGAWLLPSQPGRGIHQGVDLRGALLVTATPTLAVGALVSGSQQGWAAPLTLVLFGLALAGALLFLSVESRARNPLVPLGVFSSRARSGANLTRFLFPIGFYGSLFMGSMLLQRVLGYGAIETGLAFLPASLSVALFSLVISKRVVARFGARATVLSGLALVLVSLLLLARVPVHADYAVDVLPAMLLMGTGAGLFFMPSVTLAVTDTKPEDSGLASGLANVTQQVGGALGVALVAGISSDTTLHLLSRGQGMAQALMGGYHLAFLVAAAAMAVSLLVAALVLPRQPRLRLAARPQVARYEPQRLENQAEVDEPEPARVA